ncbi:alpha/beta hydrolase fold domain-containing protein [Verminephrobacter aporrectodeae]|uniref:alpha/beta hydrolase fold domain-containing protein n=1 Tax=Verminephrobacter aporrectodeae TaxID=1110389 RepID=UPI00023757D6|nr:alpha/beta hydrolase [Verminephrobacter aporrectodeae]
MHVSLSAPPEPVDADTPDLAPLARVVMTMGWRLAAATVQSAQGATLARLVDRVEQSAPVGKRAEVEVLFSDDADLRLRLTALRDEAVSSHRLIVAGGTTPDEVRAILSDLAFDPLQASVFVAPPSSPLQLWLCDAHGNVAVNLHEETPRVPLARDFASVLTARKIMLRADAQTNDYGRASAARWVAAYSGAPVAEIDVTPSADPLRRTYRPKTDSGRTLVYIHGGGMVYYDLDVFQPFMTHLAALTGMKIVALSYDRLPETPAQQSIDALLVRIAQCVEEEGQVVLAGDSIGGLLALFAATRLPPGTVSQIVLIYPVLSLHDYHASYEAYGQGFLLDASAMRWFRALVAPYFAARGFDPISLAADTLADIPIDLISAGCDVLADEATQFAKRTNVQHLHCADLPHDFCLYANRIASAQTGLNRIVTALTHSRR